MSAPRPASAAYTCGFTLIEVMVALVIVALGMSALLETLSVSAGNISALRDKTVAEWIAMNKVADARLALNVPTIGTTQGDIADCAHGTWHWRQDVSAVAAIPGLINITVSVRRTGNSVSKPSTTSSTPSSATSSTPSSTSTPSNLQRGFGGPSSLGATGPLGSVQNLGASGCIANAEPGGSLGGTPALGAPGSLGAPSSLNASPQLGSRTSSPGSFGASGALGTLGSSQSGGSSAAAANGSALGASNAAGALSGTSSGAGSSSTNGSTSDSSSGSPDNWLVTLTGFRGNTIAAASGESPTWAYSGFAGQGGNGANGNGANGNGANGNGVNGNGSNSGIGANGNLGTAPSLGPQTQPGNGTTGGTQ